MRREPTVKHREYRGRNSAFCNRSIFYEHVALNAIRDSQPVETAGLWERFGVVPILRLNYRGNGRTISRNAQHLFHARARANAPRNLAQGFVIAAYRESTVSRARVRGRDATREEPCVLKRSSRNRNTSPRGARSIKRAKSGGKTSWLFGGIAKL